MKIAEAVLAVIGASFLLTWLLVGLRNYARRSR
jgi:hypothetical protein